MCASDCSHSEEKVSSLIIARFSKLLHGPVSAVDIVRPNESFKYIFLPQATQTYCMGSCNNYYDRQKRIRVGYIRLKRSKKEPVIVPNKYCLTITSLSIYLFSYSSFKIWSTDRLIHAPLTLHWNILKKEIIS